MEKDQGSEAEGANGEKDNVSSSDVAMDGNGTGESNDPKHHAACWRVSGPARRSWRLRWTEEEDKILQDAVQRFNGKCWKKIAKCLPDRTDVQCLHRWQKVLNPELVKGPWTKEEDDLIVELVGKQGNKKWSEIAKQLPGRIGKQCRERWHNHLNPEINKNAWTREEELILIEAHSAYGNRWAEIAKCLSGRSENSIKNHWNCSLKKKLEQNSSYSVFDHPEFADPTPCSSKTEVGYGGDLMVKQSSGAGLLAIQNMNSEAISDACSLDLNLGLPNGRDSYLQDSKRENCRHPSRQASNSIEPSSPACTEIIQNQDKGGHAILGDHYHIIPRLSKISSNGFVTEHVNAQSTCYKDGHLMNCPSQGSPCLHLHQHLKQAWGADGDNNTIVIGGNVFAVSSDMKYGCPLSRDCRDFSYMGHSKSSHSIVPKDVVSEHSTISRMYKNFVGGSYYGLCYEPLQEKDLKVFLSTGRFPSTDSYIRQPSTSTTLMKPYILEKRSYVVSSTKSILRRAAMTFKNTPSIIRKRKFPSSFQASNSKNMDKFLTTVEGLDSYNERLPGSHEFPPAGGDNQLPLLRELYASQRMRKLKISSGISSVGKCLKDAFDDVWDKRKS
ncbi:uncharacterized protein [Coffea arabica]|uniref:Uncharacterized protein n=1 Tax=Coffea arabica TaxID=13443 RepID=A0ABM4WLD0_COFAR